MRRLILLAFLALATLIAPAQAQQTGSQTNPYWVNILSGGLAGTTSNAGSAQATTATSAAAVSYLYGFNGATWDQLQVDGSKNLKVADSQLHTDITSAQPSGTNRIGYVSDDPCTQLTKSNFTISTQVGTTQLVAPSGTTQVYVCSFSVIAATAIAVNLVGGTGAACTTGTPVGILGAATAASAASGASLAANGGLTFGNGGATVLRTTTAGHGVCLIQSGTAVLGGGGTFVQQ